MELYGIGPPRGVAVSPAVVPPVGARIGHVPGMDVDFLLVTYRPGGSSSGWAG